MLKARVTFRVMKLGRYDGGNYVTERSHKDKKNNNNSSQRELGPPVVWLVSVWFTAVITIMQTSTYVGITVVAFFAIYLLGKKLRRKKNKKPAKPGTVVLHQFFSLGIIGQWFSTLSQVGNVSSYDKDSVCKWLRFQLFQEGKSTLDRVEWSRNIRFEFLHSVSEERIPSGYRCSFECHRESHCS